MESFKSQTGCCAARVIGLVYRPANDNVIRPGFDRIGSAAALGSHARTEDLKIALF
jgi:hypothetical protein